LLQALFFAFIKIRRLKNDEKSENFRQKQEKEGEKE